MKKPKKSIQYGYKNHQAYLDKEAKKKAEPQPATAKQLWVINDLAVKLGKEFSLPLMKYEASLIIHQLKLDEWESDNENI